jgi:hypothetical protein
VTLLQTTKPYRLLWDLPAPSGSGVKLSPRSTGHLEGPAWAFQKGESRSLWAQRGGPPSPYSSYFFLLKKEVGIFTSRW